MKAQLGIRSAVALAAMLGSPLALANPTHADVFMKQAIQGNLAEIQEGELAERKGGTEGVRAFGAVLVNDHSQANQKAMAAASSMGVTPPAEPNAKQQAHYQRLASLSGKAFDKAFVNAEVKGHKKVIAKYNKEAGASNSPASTYAAASLPVLHKHLRIAESLERHPSG